MPAWYVHMESTRETVNRLRDGDIPRGFPISAAEAKEVGEICHTWRSYLALGAIGPDLFYMLPDFAHRKDHLAAEDHPRQGKAMRPSPNRRRS